MSIHRTRKIISLFLGLIVAALLALSPTAGQEKDYFYTIRTGDGLALVYGTEEGLKAVRELIARKGGKPKAQEVADWVAQARLPGVASVEYFLEAPSESAPLTLRRLTVRDAVLQGILPLVEGLAPEQAARLLRKLGWTIIREEDLQALTRGGRRPDRLAVLKGTGPHDEIIIGMRQ